MSDNIPATFRQLLATKTDEVDRPRPLAAGHYIGLIKGMEYGVSRQKQTPYVRLILQATEETADVEEGSNAGMDITRRELTKDYYITPGALYRLSDMLDAVLGKQTGRSFDERLPELRGQVVMFGVTQRLAEDNETRYNDVTTIVKA